jgi:hypothetical protein
MEKQNYNNHIRYYPPHHFIFYPLISMAGVLALVGLINDAPNRLLWFVLGMIITLLTFLALMLRQHYALMNQNRIVRLELRFRYYVLTQKRFEEVELKLSKGQIFALRFAPDEELPTLVERALKENLSGDEIKRSIKNWLPDEMRV